MPRQITTPTSIALLLLVTLGQFLSFAQESTDPTNVPGGLKARIAALESSNIPPEALATLKEAEAINAKTEELRAAATSFRERIDEVPQKMAEAGEALAEPLPPQPSESDLQQLEIAELESRLSEIKADLTKSRAEETSIEADLQSRTVRSSALPAAIAQLETTLEQLATALSKATAGAEIPTAALADTARLQAQHGLLRQTIETDRLELAYLKASAELRATEASLASRTSTHLTATLALVQAVLDQKRLAEADDQAEMASSAAALSDDTAAIAELAEVNAELTALRAGEDGLTAKLRDANTELATVTGELDLKGEYFKNAKRRVELVSDAGFSLGESTGELLRTERRTLPDQAELRNEIRADVHANTVAGLELIKLEQQRRDLIVGLEQMIAHVVGTLPPGSKKRDAVAADARRLLAERREILDQLIVDYRTLTSTLSETNLQRKALIQLTSAYAKLIDERVLWFRSAPVLNLEAFSTGSRSIGSLFSPTRWWEFSARLGRDIRSDLAIWIAAVLAIALLIIRRPAHKQHLAAASAIAERRTCRTYLPTAKALTYTTLLSLPAPLALAFIAFRHGDVGSGGIATGLYEVACQLLVFGFLRRAFYEGGLATSHFRMHPSQAKTLRLTLTTFLWFAVPVAFSLGVLDFTNGHDGARLIFITAMLVFAVFILQLLKPSRHIIQTASLRAGAFALGVLAPVILALGAVAGYFYTVRELQWRLEASLSLVLFLLLLSALIRRWFLVARRRLAIDQARKKRRAAAEAANQQATTAALTQEEVEAATIDITKIKDQTSQLLNSAMAVAVAVGLWAIWSHVLPALNILDDVHLWPDKTELETASASEGSSGSSASAPISLIPPVGDSGQQAEEAPAKPPSAPDPLTIAPPPTDPNLGWVTLADLALSLLAFVLTYIAAKNIPGLLDISILRRLDLKPGGSFAVTASARYLIVLVGVILAFGQIGITWSKVQWIAAAVTVGIGFGLQEVFANFVAGLILLFERPIRLGDYVTVGPVSGQVTRIEIRATTIKDFSNKELIVPNKEFITGQLVNWTLTDSVIRIEIPVGIAYGSDIELARKLLVEIGKKHPLTTTDPPVQAVFLHFGASSLDFELRVHIDSVQNLISVRNDLHFAIDHTFREHDIEIAFPQTDIHIRSMPEPAKPEELPPPSG